jgi:hypothetical protein
MYGLRTALHEARKGDAPARKEGLRVKYNGRTAEVSLEVIPITAPGEGRHFLVLFEEVRGSQSPARSRPPAAKRPERRLSITHIFGHSRSDRGMGLAGIPPRSILSARPVLTSPDFGTIFEPTSTFSRRVGRCHRTTLTAVM